MIELILAKAAEAIMQNVAPVSMSGGAVQPVLLKDGQRVRTVPAVPAGIDSQREGYTAMIPEDGQSALAFWQVLATQVDEKRGGATAQGIAMVARCRLVIWANKRRLNPPNVPAVLGECILQVQAADLSEDYIQGLTVTLANVERRDKGIFSEYTFDEVETQYLIEPYDFASALFDIQYSIMLTCLPEVAAVDPS